MSQEVSSIRITRPGIYDVPAEVYHRADFLPGPSLSSTGAYKLTSDCPAAFNYERANQTFSNAFDVGTAGHLLVLEPHLFDQQVVIVEGKTADGKPSVGYTSKEARDQRDDAYAAGKTPLLPVELERLKAMRKVLFEHPIARNALIGDVETERTLIYYDEEFGVWGRARPDVLPRSRRWVVNYKTSVSARPEDITKALKWHGYAQRGAWEVEAVTRVTGIVPSYMLIVQQKTEPYLVTVARVGLETLAAVDPLNRRARGIFSWCMRNNTWPDHHWKGPDASLAAIDVGLSDFDLRQLRADEEAGLYEPPPGLPMISSVAQPSLETQDA